MRTHQTAISGKERNTNVHQFETSIIPWKVSSAAMLLFVLAMTQHLTAASPPKGAICSTVISTSDFTPYLIPAGTATAELDYVVSNSVGPDKGLVCHIETYTCGYEPKVYPPVLATVTVTDGGGIVLFSDTQTSVTDTYPVDNRGFPLGVIPSPRTFNYVAHIDVHTITATADGSVYVTVSGPVTASVSYSVPQPTFTFDLDRGLAATAPGQAKLLTHKYRSDDNYPSIYQRATIVVDPAAPPPAPGTSPPPPRPQMDISGSVGNAPKSGPYDIYFKLIDPKDTSLYAAGDAHPGDNVDPIGPLLMLRDGTQRTKLGDVLHLTWDATTRKAAVVLEGTDQYAGDNYQVEASFDPGFSCEKPGTPNPCATSAVVTAWKRVYVEIEKMFRNGSSLSATVSPNALSIPVIDVRAFGKPPFRVRLIHAPRAMDSGEWHSEEVNVLAVERNPDPSVAPRVPGVLRLDDPKTPGVRDVVQQAYLGPETVLGTRRLYLADGVGVVTGTRNRDFFTSDSVLMRPLFDQAFTEHVWLTDDPNRTSNDITFDGVVPFEARADPNGETEREWIQRKWMRSADRSGEDRSAFPNHQLLICAAREWEPRNVRDVQLGLTTVSNGFNDTWLFLGDIHGTNLAREVLVHELGHQWRVDRDWPSSVHHTAGSPTGGHCDIATGAVQMMYDRSLECTMTSNIYGDPEGSDGIVGFHYVVIDGHPNSEFIQIRQRAEPVPQTELNGRIIR